MNEKLQSIIRKVLPPVAALLLLLALWTALSVGGAVPRFVLPSPGDVARAFWADRQLLLRHARVTLAETFIGLFFGIVIGFAAAVIMDRFSVVRNMLYPLLIVSQTIPTVAIAPLLVLWLGYQMLPKIVLIVLIVFFPITISMLEGYASVDPDTVRLMVSMGAHRRQIFRYVKMPSALGRFFSSLKISVSYAVVGAVLAEWLGGTEGLGCYMTRVRKAFAYDKMFAVIILISVISLILIWLTGFLQKRFMPWERVNQTRR